MLQITMYLVLLSIYFLIYIFLWWLDIKKVILFFVSWGLMLVLLQIFYLSFYSSFNIDLFFIEWNIRLWNYISRINKNIVTSDNNVINTVQIFFTFIIPALLEELLKFFAFKLVIKKINSFNTINQYLIWFAYVAMGFSFFETSFYILKIWNTTFNNLFALIISRGIISTFSHVIFSMILWYNYAKASFIKYKIIDDLEISKVTKIIKIFRKIPFIKISTLSRFYYLKFMIFWFVISTFYHSLYNFLITKWYIRIAILLIIIWLIYIIKEMTSKPNNENYKKIKDKINKLKKIKELKEEIKWINYK